MIQVSHEKDSLAAANESVSSMSAISLDAIMLLCIVVLQILPFRPKSTLH
jgi:hypothetical protein